MKYNYKEGANVAQLSEKHIKYLNNPSFYMTYFEILRNRLIYFNNLSKDTALYDYSNMLGLKDSYSSFSLIFSKLNSNIRRPLTEDLIYKIFSMMDENFNYSFFRFKDARKLLDNYYDNIDKIDIFENEAIFNVEFSKMFSCFSSNEKVSQLILIFNMLRQRYAPVIISEYMSKQYYYAKSINDIKYIRDMFEMISKKELLALDSMIESYEKDQKIKRLS